MTYSASWRVEFINFYFEKSYSWNKNLASAWFSAVHDFGVCLCVSATSAIISQSHSLLLFFEAGALTDLELTKEA